MTTTDAPVRVDHATDVTAPLPEGALKRSGHVSTVDYLRSADSVRAYFSPERTTDYGSIIAEAVTARIGETAISLPPEVWRVLIATVQQVLPAADAPLSGHMRVAAEIVQTVNAVYGLPVDAPVHPSWLRAEAERLEVGK